MPRKQRKAIIIILSVIIVAIIAIIVLLLYINTDMFKSSSTLFTKYVGQNIEKMDAIYKQFGTSEYDELLQQNKYTTETQVRINYIDNIGTSRENSQNSINDLKLKISGQTDKNNQYNYQDVNLLNKEEKVSEAEYIQNGITYGIKFSDLFNQYVAVDNENLKELFKKMGYTEENIANIPDSIEMQEDLKDIFQFSEEEKQNLRTKYMSIINSNVLKDNFTKQKNQIIEINGKNIQVNSYVLTMTKEQLNNIYIKILEEIKQEEIILSKIDKCQNKIKLYQLDKTTNLREEFVNKIEAFITEITRNNIGKDEIKIIVYENDQTTVRTVIQHPDYEITIDLLSSQDGDYAQVTYTTSDKKQAYIYEKTKEETSIIFNNTQDGKTIQYSLVINEKVNNNNATKNIVAKYEDESNRIEVIIEQGINIVDQFENQVILNDENSINLKNLEEEQVKAVLEKVNTSVSEKTNQITSDIINIEDIKKILETIGLIHEQQNLESTGITQTERNRYNSQFEILQGEELEGEEVLNIIDAIKENLVDIEVVSNTELKLKLDRKNKNEEVATTISSFIEKNKNQKYNVKVEYNEETGLVSDILLTISEK